LFSGRFNLPNMGAPLRARDEVHQRPGEAGRDRDRRLATSLFRAQLCMSILKNWYN
jgi:hypothetical protein